VSNETEKDRSALSDWQACGRHVADPSLEALRSGYFEPCESFVLERHDIAPGATIELSSEDCTKLQHHPCAWGEGTVFFPKLLVYVGSPYMWILGGTANHAPVTGMSLPMDSFRPGSPHEISWPRFGYAQAHVLKLQIQNRGHEKGNFIARLAGAYYFPGKDIPARRSWP